MKKGLPIILIFLSACVATKSFVPNQDALPAMQQKVADITLKKADSGYALYKNKCAGCHRLHHPSEYTMGKWEKSLSEMYPKAKVTSDEEKRLIRDYVIALSK